MFNLVSVLLKDDIHGYHPMLYLSALDLLFFGEEPTQRGLGLVNVQLTLVVEFFWGEVWG